MKQKLNKSQKTYIKFFSIITIIILLLYSALNQKLTITKYDYENNLIPKSFDNYTIVQLSDLHYKKFGEQNKNLIEAISSLSPNLIVMTGDMLDQRKPDFSNTENLFKGICKIAPIYLVSGNHEEQYAYKDKMSSLYKKYNIIELRNEMVKLYSKNKKDYIELYGITHKNDEQMQSFFNSNNPNDKKILNPSPNTFSILLNHRTDSFDYFKNTNHNLMLTGHTHGGIIRLPLLGGLIGNDRKLFPKYDSGKFVNDTNTFTMISSRGLGTTRGIPRIFNKPEIVVITLHSTK